MSVRAGHWKMILRCFAAAALMEAGLFFGMAQTHSAFPVDITYGRPPQPFVTDGRVGMFYELHLTNFSSRSINFNGLEVFGGNNARPLVSYRGGTLQKLLVLVGASEGGEVGALGGGHTVIVFLDIELDANVPVPAELRHRLTLAIAGKDGTLIEKTIDGPTIPVDQDAVTVLQVPLHGSGWVAVNGLAAPDHRRSLNPVDGRVRLPQRFAIDWIRLDADGQEFKGDPRRNESHFAYGSEVLAVADGVVCNLEEGLPDNAGNNEQSSRKVTLETIGGNYAILDMGHGRFAAYMHLKPGSLRVKLNQKVRAGEVLGLLGNSGNSDGPHLHFQLMDTNSVLDAEGLPYEIDNFTQLGAVKDPDALLDYGQAWRPMAGVTAVTRHKEFPRDNAVVAFP